MKFPDCMDLNLTRKQNELPVLQNLSKDHPGNGAMHAGRSSPQKFYTIDRIGNKEILPQFIMRILISVD